MLCGVSANDKTEKNRYIYCMKSDYVIGGIIFCFRLDW